MKPAQKVIFTVVPCILMLSSFLLSNWKHN